MVKSEQVSSTVPTLSLFLDFELTQLSTLSASSPVNPQNEFSPVVQPTSQLSQRQLDEDDAEREDGDVSPDSTQSNENDAGLDDDSEEG